MYNKLLELLNTMRKSPDEAGLRYWRDDLLATTRTMLVMGEVTVEETSELFRAIYDVYYDRRSELRIQAMLDREV